MNISDCRKSGQCTCGFSCGLGRKLSGIRLANVELVKVGRRVCPVFKRFADVTNLGKWICFGLINISFISINFFFFLSFSLWISFPLSLFLFLLDFAFLFFYFLFPLSIFRLVFVSFSIRTLLFTSFIKVFRKESVDDISDCIRDLCGQAFKLGPIGRYNKNLLP